MRIRCLQHTCGTINIIILPCGNIRACARRRQGQRRLERQYPSLSVDSRCRAAAPFRSRHTNSLPGAVIRSHPRCTAAQSGITAAQSGSYCCPKWKLLLPKVEVAAAQSGITAAQSGSYCCPKWKLLLPKVEVRCLSAARLESANLNTLPKWKGAFAARALIAEPIKELLIITLLVRLHHLGDQRVALRDRPPVASLERRLEELSEGAI